MGNGSKAIERSNWVKIITLTLELCEEARIWRNEVIETLRTPFMLTEEMQKAFYEQVVCNRESSHRYIGFENSHGFVAMGGITNIEWVNRIGEISLIVSPKWRKRGYGRCAAYLLYAYAFDSLGLNTVFGECYDTNPGGVRFWTSLFPDLFTVALPGRKYWNGKFYPGLYFSISQEEYNAWRKSRDMRG